MYHVLKHSFKNKLDLYQVNWQQERFQEITGKLGHFLKQAGFKVRSFQIYLLLLSLSHLTDMRGKTNTLIFLLNLFNYLCFIFS